MFVSGALLGALVVWIATSLAGASAQVAAPTTVDVNARQVSFRLLDQRGSTADGFIIRYNLFDKSSGTRVGFQIIDCFTLSPLTSKNNPITECNASERFTGKGMLSEVGFASAIPKSAFVVPIDGGTGTYQNARGQLKFIPTSETTFEEIYSLIP
jgi:hypothetical protein